MNLKLVATGAAAFKVVDFGSLIKVHDTCPSVFIVILRLCVLGEAYVYLYKNVYI